MNKEKIMVIVKDIISNNSGVMPFDNGEEEIRIDGNAFDHIAEEIAEEIIKREPEWKKKRKRCVGCKAEIIDGESICNGDCDSTEWEYF